MIRTRPPRWFWIVVVLLIGWGLMGIVAFYLSQSADVRAAMTPYDRSLYERQPAWHPLVYGTAVWAGLAGSVLLAVRRRHALPFFVVSLVGIVVMFGWTFAATDLIAVKGILTAVTFPLVIALVCVGQIALARRALRHGWIG